MSNLILDETTHIYYLDNKRIDGLTSTIAEAGLMGNFGSEWHMDRGTKIHLATEYYDKGTLDESTVDPEIVGYLESWKRFRKERNYTPIAIEHPIFHPELLVASRVDRLPLLDIKSGSQAPWHALQIAFQWTTLRIGCEVKAIWSPMDVYLDPGGGSPKIKTYTYRELKEAFQAYCSMLHFIRWKREKGIKNGNPS